MSYCGQHTLVKTNLGSNERTAKRLYCNAWSCPDCAPRRAKRLIAEAMGGRPRTFLTLTLRADYPGGPIAQARALNAAWRTLRQAICRRYKLKHLPHLTVMEQTKLGTPHLHVLCRAPFIPQVWISEKMKRYVDAPVVDIRRIDAHRKVASYVAKYVGKGPHQFGTCKRYYKSRDYELRPEWRGRRRHGPDVAFTRLDRPLWSVVAHWQQQGWYVEPISPDKVWASPIGPPRAAAQGPPGASC